MNLGKIKKFGEPPTTTLTPTLDSERPPEKQLIPMMDVVCHLMGQVETKFSSCDTPLHLIIISGRCRKWWKNDTKRSLKEKATVLLLFLAFIFFSKFPEQKIMWDYRGLCGPHSPLNSSLNFPHGKNEQNHFYLKKIASALKGNLWKTNRWSEDNSIPSAKQPQTLNDSLKILSRGWRV